MSHDPTHRGPEDVHRADTERLAEELAAETEVRASHLAAENDARALPIAENSQRLAQTAAILVSSVGGLAREVKILAARIGKSERAVRIALAGLILDLVLSSAVVFGLVAQSETDETLRDEIARQAQIRTNALCPLYALLIDSRSAAGRDRYPQGPEAYDRAFADLDAAYQVIACEPK